jgi:formylglycine-generating enzyme required for sulfatase activity
MIDLPGGPFAMKVRHERRECGCVPFGATDAVMWGWFYKDVIEHVAAVDVRRFSMRKTAVTNAEFVAFVHGARYEPAERSRFLAHLPREVDGRLPEVVPPELAELPVTFVSLADARAFAAWYGERLPNEAEWQWAAEGAGAGRFYPWGDEPRTPTERLGPAADPATSTPQGIEGLSGNAWELTESEHTDGHTRFVMLRGGVFLARGESESEWLPPCGARPNTHHAKYLLLADGLDRSETVSFRTVR